MGRTGAFLTVERKDHGVRPASESLGDYEEFVKPLPTDEQLQQASRCMNCGVAFCQSGLDLGQGKSLVGCPLHNLIPETNDLLYRRRWDDAVGRLFLTNPFPEFTGRVCPSPCETACNLGLHSSAVTIHDNERALADYAWDQGLKPLPAAPADAPLVSIVGSGPAGLAAAWDLARRRWRVRVYERADRPGGLLTYGIPSMKLDKAIVERRINLMKESGIEFFCSTDATTIVDQICKESDAVILAAGASVPRAVAVPGADLGGIYFAVDYLTEVTKALLEDRPCAISAEGKDVAVIGGGDTGVDCVACALRQGAKSVRQIIRASRPSDSCEVAEVWPGPRPIYDQGYGQREAEETFGEDPRLWSKDTIAFVGEESVEAVRIQDISYDGGRHLVEGTEEDVPASLVLIAKGFLGAEPTLFEAFGVSGPNRENPNHFESKANDFETSVYVAGDARLGASLVATAIADGLSCAEEVATDFQA